MNKNIVLYWYEKMAALTGRMLVLTHTHQWGDLPALEIRYDDMTEQLKMVEPLYALNAEQSAEKCHLLRVINSNQYTISSFIQPQLDVLGAGSRSLGLQQYRH